MKIIKKIYNWMGSRVYTPYGDLLLGFLFYLEALFFIPTDPMLIIYCIERPKKGFYYAFIATATSVLGGLTGYGVGYWLWHSMGEEIITSHLFNLVMSPEIFEYLRAQYRLYDASAIFIAGFTPIPYKAATLTAGFCNLELYSFIVYSILGRGARFFLYAIVIRIWGKGIKKYIDRYFNLLVLLALVLILGGIWMMKK